MRWRRLQTPPEELFFIPIRLRSWMEFLNELIANCAHSTGLGIIPIRVDRRTPTVESKLPSLQQAQPQIRERHPRLRARHPRLKRPRTRSAIANPTTLVYRKFRR